MEDFLKDRIAHLLIIEDSELKTEYKEVQDEKHSAYLKAAVLRVEIGEDNVFAYGFTRIGIDQPLFAGIEMKTLSESKGIELTELIKKFLIRNDKKITNE